MNAKPPTIPFRIEACTFSDNLSRNSCMGLRADVQSFLSDIYSVTVEFFLLKLTVIYIHVIGYILRRLREILLTKQVWQIFVRRDFQWIIYLPRISYRKIPKISPAKYRTARLEVLPNLRHAGVFQMSTMVNLGIGFQFKSLWLVQVLNLTRRWAFALPLRNTGDIQIPAC